MNEINFSRLKRASTIKTHHAYYIGIIIRILCKEKITNGSSGVPPGDIINPKCSNSGHNVLKHEDSVVLQEKAPRILK